MIRKKKTAIIELRFINKKMGKIKSKEVAVIVAHPDDETLWAGGILLEHTEWQCFIICLCRKHDADRAPKFHKALNVFLATGAMGDLDDGPEQLPLDQEDIESAILDLLPKRYYDLIITHNPLGEYTRHLRHEEIGSAVLSLWKEGRLSSNELLVFAYEDGNKKYFPKAMKVADIYMELPAELWNLKYNIITDIYGFDRDSWEAKVTPKAEAFWRFTKKRETMNGMEKESTK
jgi:LmbE family N-acetylglucosaminyl deacetylase